MVERDEKGCFKRTRQPWTPENWDDGYFDNRGRFRIYRPDYPRAYALGYALRSHVVWWLERGRAHNRRTELHHKDHDRSNDRIENLEPLSHSKHKHQHVRAETKGISCARCKKIFQAKMSRVRERGVKYCSVACYQKHKRSPQHKENIAKGLRAAWAEGRRS